MLTWDSLFLCLDYQGLFNPGIALYPGHLSQATYSWMIRPLIQLFRRWLSLLVLIRSMHHTRNEVHELSLCEAVFAYLVIVGFCENVLGPFLVKYQACPASFALLFVLRPHCFHLKKFLKYQQHSIHLLITTVMNIINFLVALACNVTFYNILDSDIVSRSGGKGWWILLTNL